MLVDNFGVFLGDIFSPFYQISTSPRTCPSFLCYFRSPVQWPAIEFQIVSASTSVLELTGCSGTLCLMSHLSNCSHVCSRMDFFPKTENIAYLFLADIFWLETCAHYFHCPLNLQFYCPLFCALLHASDQNGLHYQVLLWADLGLGSQNERHQNENVELEETFCFDNVSSSRFGPWNCNGFSLSPVSRHLSISCDTVWISVPNQTSCWNVIPNGLHLPLASTM